MFKNLLYRRILLGTILLIAIAIFQTYSLWLPIDEFVDESELAYYAVGFFGLDFDPHWYGYGNLGMYILYVWYMLLFLFEWIVGNVTNIDAFTQKLFYTTYFIDWGRFLFAGIGIGTIFIYAYLIKKYTVSIFATVFFLLVSLMAYETIHFANYIRPDQLVSFFISLLILIVINMKKQRLYYLAIIIAALISSKISTLFLGIFLIYYLVYYYLKKEISIKYILFVFIIFLIALIVFQPYNSPISLMKFLLSMQSDSDMFFGNQTYIEKAINTIKYSYTHITLYVNKYLLFALFLLPFLQKKYYRFVLVIFIIVFLLIVPYIFDNGVVRYYWLNPVYDLIRLLAVLVLFNFIELVTQVFCNSKQIKIGTNSILFLLLVSILYIELVSYGKLIEKYKTPSNKSMAKSWIESYLLQQNNILIDGHRGHIIPKIYDINNIKESENISRVFIFNKHKNKYLHEQFQIYLQDRYMQTLGYNLPSSKFYVKKLYAFDVNDIVLTNKIQNSYFVTSPAIYKSFMNKKFVRIGHKHKEVNNLFKEHYTYMTKKNKLVKSFTKGIGATVEIYYIK